MNDDLMTIEFEGMLLGRYVSPTLRHNDGGPGLDRSAYTVLTRLQLQGPMSTSELSEAFGLDVSTLHRQANAMLRVGLVERIPDPEGGIARKFRVSDQGLAALATDRKVKLSGLSEILEDWSAEDVGRLAELLSRFNADIERRDGRPWPRPDDRQQTRSFPPG